MKTALGPGKKDPSPIHAPEVCMPTLLSAAMSTGADVPLVPERRVRFLMGGPQNGVAESDCVAVAVRDALKVCVAVAVALAVDDRERATVLDAVMDLVDDTLELSERVGLMVALLVLRLLADCEPVPESDADAEPVWVAVESDVLVLVALLVALLEAVQELELD